MLIKQILYAALITSLLCSNTEGNDRPNLLLLSIDDLNDWVGCMGGHAQAKTPNIDRLAQRGVLFTNAHCQAPLCGPSRASWLSGRYPHATGVYQQPIKDTLAKDDTFFRGHLMPEYFAKNGYHTLGVGKITHGYPGKIAFHEYGGNFHGFGPYPPGRQRFNYFLPDVPWSGTLTDWGKFPDQDTDLSDTKTADWAIKNLNRNFDKPFLMGVGFVRPHVPFYVPAKWFDLFPLSEIQLPEILEEDLSDVPETGRAVHEVPKYPNLRFLQAEKGLQHRKCVQAYLACVAYVDHQVGRVLAALESSQHAENTIIVLLSDHGYHLGEKDRVSKHSLWEESTHVPLCFVDLRTKTKNAVAVGKRSDLPVGLIDIFPTLIDLCRIPKLTSNEGMSLAKVLSAPHETTLSRQGVLTTYAKGNHAIRTERYRYIRYEDGSEELYDHDADPREWRNLAGTGNAAETLAQLRLLLPKHDAPYHASTSTKPINQWFEAHFERHVNPKLRPK